MENEDGWKIFFHYNAIWCMRRLEAEGGTSHADSREVHPR